MISSGATLAEPLKEGEKPKMTGSVMIALADSEAEVREILQKDIYVESGVWNWDAVTITPVSRHINCAWTLKIDNVAFANMR